MFVRSFEHIKPQRRRSTCATLLRVFDDKRVGANERLSQLATTVNCLFDILASIVHCVEGEGGGLRFRLLLLRGLMERN